jgi:hypothetical protein
MNPIATNKLSPWFYFSTVNVDIANNKTHFWNLDATEEYAEKALAMFFSVALRVLLFLRGLRFGFKRRSLD